MLPAEDDELIKVHRALIRAARVSRQRTLADRFAALVRQALDEVIDGPRTGRWDINQLDPTEQSYIGTKLEIIARTELRLERGVGIDLQVAGVGVDVKWSRTSQWMIGPENVGHLCLGIGLIDAGTAFCVGLFRASPEYLRPGQNRDRKRSLSAAGKAAAVVWLVDGATVPPDFIATLPEGIREQIVNGTSAQHRVRLLAELVPERFIPRDAFRTAARNKADPMRRLRQDKGNKTGLGGLVLLSSKYGKADLAALGIENPPKDSWYAVSKKKLAEAKARPGGDVA